MMWMSRNLPILILLLFNINILASDIVIAEEEAKIMHYIDIIKNDIEGGRRGLYNDSIRNVFRNVLIKSESFDYPFDSLDYIQILRSDDGNIAVITWCVPSGDGIYNYYGFIQKRDKNDSTVELFELEDKSIEYKDVFMSSGSPKFWFGTVYYDIIQKVIAGNTYYTLLGVDFNDSFTKKKVIEILTFDDGRPVFGEAIIMHGRKMNRRLVFEYSSRASMMLKYFENKDMIIFDHLSPIKAGLSNSSQFFAPDLSYDALVFRNERWEFISDIDLRAPKL